MDISGLVGELFSSGDRKKGYDWRADSEGLNYFVSPSINEKINNGKAKLWVSQQHIAMRMLVEQGDAEEIPNGFIIPTEVAVNLDDISQELLGMPLKWAGRIEADIKGNTAKSNFLILLKLETSSGDLTQSYEVTGPILRFSETQEYLLTSAQQLIFGSIAVHQLSDKTEYDNLLLVMALQEAQQKDGSIKLSHFDKFDIKAPKSVSIEAALDDEGNLILTPFMGQDADHERIQKVLGQLRSDQPSSLRVNNEIILFDEERLKAVHEILRNRKVPQKDVKQFLENPTAFIDASFVDLDIGFSVRVRGAIKFKHAYFGETDESGIDWFGAGGGKAQSVLPINKLVSYIHDWLKFSEFEENLKNAQTSGAEIVSFEGKSFDISDQNSVKETIEKIKQKLESGEGEEDVDGGGSGEGDNENPPQEPEEKPELVVVDVDLNDEHVETASPTLEKSISEMLYPADELDWSNYSRTPYPHQYKGIQWILGLVTAKEKFEGGLLADDMGLGKTLMALSAVDHLYKLNEKEEITKKPCLVVAPLSLLQNWKDEVDETFSSSPFKDIIILQSDADLPNYRVGKAETKQQEIEEDSIAEIRFSLKVGNSFTLDRLDQPQRLIITTYQTLRDYQFSLCSIDWGMVIFDEAQNIKNPNTLQTRAAKGLKSDFKLLATGTPVENKLTDFWCLMDTAIPGYLDSYQDFRERYISPILHAAGDEIEDVRGRVGRELRLKVGPLMLRRVKEDNLEGLPSKKIFVGIKDDNDWEYKPSLDKTMINRQLDIYDATLNSQDSAEKNIVLEALHRLKVISLHPQLVDGGRLKIPEKNRLIKTFLNESGKLESLLSTLDEIKKRKEKCIIFAVSKHLQTSLSLALGKLYGLGIVSIINGDTKAVSNNESTPIRKTIIKDFENLEGFNIIIMSPIAAGVGLTIIGANNVIHLERHWNPAKEAQATDRVFRIGQKKDVNVYVPILHHPVHESFDANLHRLLSQKTMLKDAVVTPEQVIPNPEGMGEQVNPSHRIKSSDMHKLSWQQFEALCAELFFKEYSASSCWLTQVNDHGADVAMIVDKSVRLIQCKHTQTGKYIGYEAIQEIYSAKPIYAEELSKNVDLLIFATNAKILSSKTRKTAKQSGVKIFSYKDLSELLDQHEITYEMIFKRLSKEKLKI